MMTRSASADGVAVHSAGTPLASASSVRTSTGSVYLAPNASRRARRSTSPTGRGVAFRAPLMASISGFSTAVPFGHQPLPVRSDRKQSNHCESIGAIAALPPAPREINMTLDTALRVACILGCACVLSVAPLSASADVSVAAPATQAAIVAAVEKQRKTYGGKTPVPGVLIVVWDGSGGSYMHGFGDADLAAHRPLTAADHFRVGSNTKTFVISVLLQIVDEGKLSLNDPLSHFSLGVTIPNAEHITVAELCQMRSGLFEAFDSPEFDNMKLEPDMKFDPRTIIGWAVEQKPYFAPGKGYRYSNTNYLILGLLIESITKEPVGEQIRKRILEPFHL